ncbi:integrase core domain-containing protein [Xanthobacter agilis]|uniref:integrase core domain-containing protein n=1 Tax=Xanthobacter agilis TaxID=47492 RepID=UPI0037297712
MLAVADTSLPGLRGTRDQDPHMAIRGKPIQNGLVESFNDRFRDECLHETLFSNLTQLRVTISAGKKDDNLNPSHSALAHQSPAEFTATITLENVAA